MINNWKKNYEKRVIKDLDKNGFSVLENVLSIKECDNLKKELNILENIKREQIKKKVKSTKHLKRSIAGGQVFIRNLFLEKPKPFLKTIDLKPVLNILKKVFNDVFILDGSVASKSILIKDFSRHSNAHIDSHIPVKNLSNTLDVVVFLCLDDFYKENGSTKVWPKSHKTGIAIHKRSDYKKIYSSKKFVYLNAKKGSIVFLLGQTWHQIGNCINDKSRWAILNHYKRWWIKPTTDFTKCGKKIFKNLNLDQKVLLGFSSISPKFGTERLKTKMDEKNIPSEYNKALKV